MDVIQVIRNDDLETFKNIFDIKKVSHYLHEIGTHGGAREILRYLCEREDVDLNSPISVCYCGMDAIKHFIALLLFNEYDDHLEIVRKYYTKYIDEDVLYTKYVDINYMRLLVDMIVKDKQLLLDSYEKVIDSYTCEYDKKQIHQIFKSKYLSLKYPDDFERDLEELNEFP